MLTRFLCGTAGVRVVPFSTLLTLADRARITLQRGGEVQKEESVESAELKATGTATTGSRRSNDGQTTFTRVRALRQQTFMPAHSVDPHLAHSRVSIFPAKSKERTLRVRAQRNAER